MTEDDIEFGRFRIRAIHRRVDGDEGITVHVFGPVGAKVEEVLRFDCFLRHPHYHLGWSYRFEPFTSIEATSPLEWAMEQLEHHANEFLARAGAERMNDEELVMLPKAVSRLRALGDRLSRAA